MVFSNGFPTSTILFKKTKQTKTQVLKSAEIAKDYYFNKPARYDLLSYKKLYTLWSQFRFFKICIKNGKIYIKMSAVIFLISIFLFLFLEFSTKNVNYFYIIRKNAFINIIAYFRWENITCHKDIFIKVWCRTLIKYINLISKKILSLKISTFSKCGVVSLYKDSLYWWHREYT